MNFMKKNKNKLIPCTGCGRHVKQVEETSKAYFCIHCIQENGNYNRYRNNYDLIKPLKNIKDGDIVLGANGKPYSIIKFDSEIDEDKFYQCTQFFGKEECEIRGDYFFVRKLKIRESKKIRKMVEERINTIYLTYDKEIELSCLDCVNRKGNNCTINNKSLLFCDANKCDNYA